MVLSSEPQMTLPNYSFTGHIAENKSSINYRFDGKLDQLLRHDKSEEGYHMIFAAITAN
jgi:hypothetical protein